LSQSSWSRFIKRHDIPHKAGSKFWPKSKLVQTKDRPTKGFKRKKKGETEGVEGGEEAETGGLDAEQRSGTGLSRLHEEESQSPAQYEQPTTTHQRQTPTFAHSPSLGTSANQQIASISQPQHTNHGHNSRSDQQVSHSDLYSGFPEPDQHTSQSVHPGRTWIPIFTS
jgi:hypothetical protein